MYIDIRYMLLTCSVFARCTRNLNGAGRVSVAFEIKKPLTCRTSLGGDQKSAKRYCVYGPLEKN